MNDDVPISISWDEFNRAVDVALVRNTNAIRLGRAVGGTRTDIGFDRHVIGSLGEYAVAKYFDICWIPKVTGPDTGVGDIPPNLHVKATLRESGQLIVQVKDPPKFDYILVYVELRRIPNCPVAHLRGWIHGSAVQQAGTLRQQGEPGVHTTSYWIHPDKLNAMGTLRHRHTEHEPINF